MKPEKSTEDCMCICAHVYIILKNTTDVWVIND